MSNKKALSLLIISLFAVSGCRFWDRTMQDIMMDPFEGAGSSFNDVLGTNKQVEPAELAMPRSVIVCRSKQCAPIKLSTSKEYIYNSLVQMFQNNNHQKALVCNADIGSHNCYQNYVSLPITVGVTPAYMYIDSVKISDISLNKGSRSLDLMLNYNVSYNGQTPDCAPDKTRMYVKNVDNIVMEDGGYRCKMTTIGTTTVKTLFLVDFIDLDYGFIGGYYSIGLSGPAYGGGSGYMMFRLPKTGYPLLPLPKDPKKKAQLTPAQKRAQEYMESSTEEEENTVDGVQVFPISYKK